MSNEDFENMDVRLQAYITYKIIEKKKQERIMMQLDIAEAFNFAYTGSKSNNGKSAYAKWRQEKIKELNPVSNELTIWEKRDMIKKKKSGRF